MQLKLPCGLIRCEIILLKLWISSLGCLSIMETLKNKDKQSIRWACNVKNIEDA